MGLTSDLCCYYCLSNACSLRVDKKSRGWFGCRACGARTFLYAWRDVARSLAIVQPLVAAKIEEIRRDVGSAEDAAVREENVGAVLREMLHARQGAAQSAMLDSAPLAASGGRR